MDALGYFQEYLAIQVNAKIRFLKKVRILVRLLIIIFLKWMQEVDIFGKV